MKKLPVLGTQEVENINFQSLQDFINPIYLDNNATTRVDEDAVVAMMRTMENDYGNPSASHNYGHTSFDLIKEARQNVADFIGCKSNEIIFVSSGTEGINAVINSVTSILSSRKTIITCATEHSATLNKIKYGQKYNSILLSVDNDGEFSLDVLEEQLKNNITSNLLVSLMAVNNETGTIHNNIYGAIDLAHKYNTLIHIDAIQAAGKIPLKPYIDAGVDYLTISGHKFHAPKGIGAVYIKTGSPFEPIFFGGNQEYGLRAGTENVPGIVGMGVVAKKMPKFGIEMTELHDLFHTLLKDSIPSCIINGGGLHGTINVGFKYVHREAMVIKLSEYDLYASIGSACSSGFGPSHVLKAMDVSQDYIHGSVRFSLSKYTTKNEIIRAIPIIDKAYTELRNMSLGIIT